MDLAVLGHEDNEGWRPLAAITLRLASSPGTEWQILCSHLKLKTY